MPSRAETERAKDLALFVVRIGIQPSEYWNLTLLEREEIVKEYNRSARRRS
ncbi:hypothetical protein HUN59_04625 [Curtobacterium sp. Csp2]|uniref:hypothetical protein n=1 Tax=Curtobacterium sp. Csp2 TaxID=2495430 RepID=UPI0015806015|nr:hypothetical protein [Curtobacterium sp. Csp2]QKS15596.1 hypothetical protein HUN59_04625 [Curtobacterium sp. Csp2]